MAGRFVIAEWMPALDANGKPLGNASISVYLNNTTTLANIYSDENLTVPMDNPVEANSSGQFPVIWVDDTSLYSASVSSDYGAPGRPTTYDNLMPSADQDASQSAAQAAASAQEATSAASVATTMSASAAGSASSAAFQANNAYTYAGQAQMASLAAGFVPGAQTNLPRELTAATIASPGSGYTNNTYDITTTGGSMSVQGVVRVVVAGGVITSATVIEPGLYVGASPVAPTVPLAALGGGTGGSVTVTLGLRFTSGQTYWSDHASDPALGQLYLNNGTSTPAAQAGETFVKTLIAGMVPCSFGGSANAPALTPLLPVSGGGLNQRFWAFCGGANNGTPMTCSVAGVFGGAQTTVLMPDGTAPPANATKTLYPMQVVPVVISGNNRFILVEPTFQPQQSVIACTILSDTTGAIVAKITNPQIKTAADLTGTRLQMKMVNNKVAASPSLELRAFDGTTVLIAATPMRDKNDQATLQPANLWLANDTLEIERVMPSGRWNLVAPAENVTSNVMVTSTGISPSGQVPSIERSTAVRRVGLNMWFVDVRAHDDHYSGGVTSRRQSDFARYILYNQGEFQSIAFAPTLNSMISRRFGEFIDHANHSFDYLVSGIITNNGHVPSTFEAVFMAGIFGNAINGTNFQLAGRGHGHELALTWQMIGTTDDASTGNVPVQSADLKSMPIGPTFYGDKLVSTYTGYGTVPTGQTAFKATYVHTFESVSAHQLRVQMTQDFTDAAVSIVPGTAPGGYACMFPMRDVDKMQPISGASLGPIYDVNLQDGSTQVLTMGGGLEPNGLLAWDSQRTFSKARIVNNAGAGYTHWENGVLVPRTADWFAINNTWGTKGYDPIYSNTTSGKNMSGLVLTYDSAYTVLF